MRGYKAEAFLSLELASRCVESDEMNGAQEPVRDIGGRASTRDVGRLAGGDNAVCDVRHNQAVARCNDAEQSDADSSQDISTPLAPLSPPHIAPPTPTTPTAVSVVSSYAQPFATIPAPPNLADLNPVLPPTASPCRGPSESPSWERKSNLVAGGGDGEDDPPQQEMARTGGDIIAGSTLSHLPNPAISLQPGGPGWALCASHVLCMAAASNHPLWALDADPLFTELAGPNLAEMPLIHQLLFCQYLVVPNFSFALKQVPRTGISTGYPVMTDEARRAALAATVPEPPVANEPEVDALVGLIEPELPTSSGPQLLGTTPLEPYTGGERTFPETTPNQRKPISLTVNSSESFLASSAPSLVVSNQAPPSDVGEDGPASGPLSDNQIGNSLDQSVLNKSDLDQSVLSSSSHVSSSTSDDDTASENQSDAEVELSADSNQSPKRDDAPNSIHSAPVEMNAVLPLSEAGGEDNSSGPLQNPLPCDVNNTGESPVDGPDALAQVPETGNDEKESLVTDDSSSLDREDATDMLNLDLLAVDLLDDIRTNRAKRRSLTVDLPSVVPIRGRPRLPFEQLFQGLICNQGSGWRAQKKQRSFEEIVAFCDEIPDLMQQAETLQEKLSKKQQQKKKKPNTVVGDHPLRPHAAKLRQHSSADPGLGSARNSGRKRDCERIRAVTGPSRSVARRASSARGRGGKAMTSKRFGESARTNVLTHKKSHFHGNRQLIPIVKRLSNPCSPSNLGDKLVRRRKGKLKKRLDLVPVIDRLPVGPRGVKQLTSAATDGPWSKNVARQRPLKRPTQRPRKSAQQKAKKLALKAMKQLPLKKVRLPKLKKNALRAFPEADGVSIAEEGSSKGPHQPDANDEVRELLKEDVSGSCAINEEPVDKDPEPSVADHACDSVTEQSLVSDVTVDDDASTGDVTVASTSPDSSAPPWPPAASVNEPPSNAGVACEQDSQKVAQVGPGQATAQETLEPPPSSESPESASSSHATVPGEQNDAPVSSVASQKTDDCPSVEDLSDMTDVVTSLMSSFDGYTCSMCGDLVGDQSTYVDHLNYRHIFNREKYLCPTKKEYFCFYSFKYVEADCCFVADAACFKHLASLKTHYLSQTLLLQ